MTSILEYSLSNGFIHHWLVAGPQVLTLPAPGDLTQNISDANLHQHFASPLSDIVLPAVDLAPITAELPSIKWRYYHCREDHFIELSNFYSSTCFLRSWAAVQVESPTPQEVKLQLASVNPIQIWLNGQLVLEQGLTERGKLHRTIFSVNLLAGKNDLLVHFTAVGRRGTPHRFALQFINEDSEQLKLLIPTEIEPEFLGKRIHLEKVIEQAYIEKYVYGQFIGDRYNKNEPIPLKFLPGVESPDEFIFRLQDLQENIFQQGIRGSNKGLEHQMARDFPLRNGPHQLALFPIEKDYYIDKIRFDRRELFHIVRTAYSTQPYGTYAERRKQALDDAAERRNESVYCEIAKAHLGKWADLKKEYVHKALTRVQQQQEGSVRDLLGLLGLALRYRRSKYFSKETFTTIRAASLAYCYTSENPGNDYIDFTSESRQLLFLTCEILAGYLSPKQTFSQSGKPGAWHVQRSEEMVIKWLQQRGQYGFQEWDSPDSLEEILAALAHLVDLSPSETLVEIASVMMDKIFFYLALNSFQGVYGSACANGDASSLLSARLEDTSGISRLMLGMGNFNESILGTVSLAGCRHYTLPELISQIAVDPAAAIWSRQSHADPEATTVKWVNKSTYKTSDYVLSSAQDYHPGEPGNLEHLWQATLGADAIVYTNHPATMNELAGLPANHELGANLWSGNGVLPRVAQWGDVLFAIYQLPMDDWLGFTHAYFPARTFDEFYFQDNWAFARKGNGFLALTAVRGLEFITCGQTAYRELRSYGNQNIWICHMGQALLDGEFKQFQEKILGLPLHFDPSAIHLISLRGEQLSFGWSTPLLVNQQEQPLSGFKHIESPYCVVDFPAEQMDIIYKDKGIRLKFN
jgi:hypothetical protein